MFEIVPIFFSQYEPGLTYTVHLSNVRFAMAVADHYLWIKLPRLPDL